MRVPAFPIIASVVLLAAPAFAQTSTNPSAQPAGTSSATEATKGSSPTPDEQEKIRQSMEQSGFKNVRVAPESFVIQAQAPDGSQIAMMNVRVVPESFAIHAQAPDGSPIALMISPDGVTGAIETADTSTEPQGSGQAAPSSQH
jgi:hypothetical protein